MKKKVLVLASLVVMMAGLVGVIQPRTVSATQNKVTICHATSSNQNSNNPYNAIDVPISAIDGQAGNQNGNTPDHYGEHDSNNIASNFFIHQWLKTTGKDWGDIIPPTDAQPTGLNWTTVGQAVYNNDCNYIKFVKADDVLFTDPTCDTLGSYIIPKTKGVKYVIEGETFQKGEYTAANGSTITVNAVAKKGYVLIGTTEWSKTFTAPEDCPVEEVADIKYGVVCSANGAVVTLTNEGNAEGSVTLNGEVIAVAASAIVERTFDTTDAGLQITITIDEEVVYDQLVVCDTGDVLGETDTPVVLPNTSGSIAGIVAIIASLSLIAGLISLGVRSQLTRQ